MECIRRQRLHRPPRTTESNHGPPGRKEKQMSGLGGLNDMVHTILNPATMFLKKKGGDTPAVKPPAVMPTIDDKAVQDARMRRIAEMQARSGRASTIFTGQEEKIGG
jgi:hypothetical protein